MFGEKVFAYIGINPSTATAKIDDQTVKKWVGFTIRNNGAAFLVANVFSYRSTDVKELARVDDPVGPENDRYLLEVIKEADIIVPCWGSRDKVPDTLHPHLDKVIALLKESGKPVRCFGLTASGDPKHPLMLSYETPLEPL
jgi:hypothetical protein